MWRQAPSRDSAVLQASCAATFQGSNSATRLAAALFHALVRRDGVYEAMAPYPVDGAVPSGVTASQQDRS
jgi:hypothetical protein